MAQASVVAEVWPSYGHNSGNGGLNTGYGLVRGGCLVHSSPDHFSLEVVTRGKFQICLIVTPRPNSSPHPSYCDAYRLSRRFLSILFVVLTYSSGSASSLNIYLKVAFSPQEELLNFKKEFGTLADNVARPAYVYHPPCSH